MGPLEARGHKGVNTEEAANNHLLVEEPPILIDRSAFNQGINAKYDTHISDDPITPSLVARGPHAVATTFVKAKRAQSATDDETWVEGDINPTINQFDQGDVRATTAIVMRQREGKAGGGKGPLPSENKSLTLAAAGNDQTLFVEQPIVFENSYRDSARIAEDGVTQTLSAKMGTGGGNTPMVAFATNQRAEVRELGDKAVALSAEPGTNQQTYVAIGIQGNVIGRQDHNGPAGKGHTEEGDPMFTLKLKIC